MYVTILFLSLLFSLNKTNKVNFLNFLHSCTCLLRIDPSSPMKLPGYFFDLKIEPEKVEDKDQNPSCGAQVSSW